MSEGEISDLVVTETRKYLFSVERKSRAIRMEVEVRFGNEPKVVSINDEVAVVVPQMANYMMAIIELKKLRPELKELRF